MKTLTAVERACGACVGDAVWPHPEDAPRQRLLVMDVDGFGIGFVRTLLVRLVNG